MFKKKKKFITIAIIITLIISLIVSLNFNRKITKVENIFSTILLDINKLFNPFTYLNDDKNIDQSSNYLIQKNLNDSLTKEINELKDTLELNRTLTNFSYENATVLSRNKEYWFNTIIIDKGSKNGIKVDMPVITKNGLVGKITKVYYKYSEVKLLTANDENYKVSVSIKINDQDNFAILSGYDSKNNLLKITEISKDLEIKKDSTVLTSGLGELFPSGIYIGKVAKTEIDKYDLSKIAYIKTDVNFNNIHYVTILKEKK